MVGPCTARSEMLVFCANLLQDNIKLARLKERETERKAGRKEKRKCRVNECMHARVSEQAIASNNC